MSIERYTGEAPLKKKPEKPLNFMIGDKTGSANTYISM